MLSSLICLKYLKEGTCPNHECKLKHVKDVSTMELGKRPSTSSGPLKAASSKEDVKMRDTASEGFKKMEEPEKKKKPCEYLFVKGFCKMGSKCYYSHVPTKAGARLPERGGARGGRGGDLHGSFSSRGGHRGRSSFGGRGGFRGGPRGGFGGPSRGGFRGGRGGFSADFDAPFAPIPYMDPFEFDVPDVPSHRMRHYGGGKVIRL